MLKTTIKKFEALTANELYTILRLSKFSLFTLNPTEIAKVGLDFSYLLEKRKNSNGNYNAMLGFITGFKVGSSGETYELEVTIKGMGQMPPTMMIQKPIIKRSNKASKQSTSSFMFILHTNL